MPGRPRAAIYGRLSSDMRIGTDREGENVDEQVAKARARAEERGYEVVEVFRENDTTAGGYRPVYQRLRSQVAEGRFDVVVVYKTDRLYRKVRELEDLIDLAEKLSLGIEAVEEGRVDLATRDGRTQARLRVTIAEDELDRIGERTADGKRRAKLSGRLPGTGLRPIGFEAEYLFGTDGEPLLSKRGHHRFRLTGRVDEHEAPVIRESADMILAGATLGAVARYWQTNGITHANGQPKSAKTIRAVLLNPLTSGRVAQRIGSNDQWRIFEDIEAKWERILDPDIQDRVRVVLTDPARRNRGGRNRSDGQPKRVFWLSPVAVCGHCGIRLAPLYSATSTYEAYKCQPSRSGCGSTSIAKAKLEEHVAAEVAAFVRSPERLDEKLSGASQANTQAGTRRSDITAELEALDLARAETFRLMVEPTSRVTPRDQVQALEAFADKRRRLEADLDAAIAEDANLDGSALEYLREVAKRGRLDEMPAQEWKDLARLLIEEVRVGSADGRQHVPAADRVNIIWR